MRNPTLFSRIFNTPLMIQPAKLDAILAGIGGRFGMDIPMPEMALTASGEHKQPGYQVLGSVAHLEVFGILAHRGGFDANSSYILGYDRIGQAFSAAMNDATVKSILLEMDSPGGEVAGAFELAAMIREGGKTKPVNAVISNMATSAGYLLASAAGDIAISDTGNAGSIGVFLRHLDVSRMADNEGLKVTYVFAGGHKVDGNPYQPLPDTVKRDLQGEIDKVYTLFVNTVAEYRGLPSNAVKAQEARVYSGEDAIKAGLADRIATPDEVLTEMRRGIYRTDKAQSAALAALQAKLEADMGWQKAIKEINNPTPPGIAPIAINGRVFDTYQQHQEKPNDTIIPNKQATSDAGWEKAVEKANAQTRESTHNTVQPPHESTNKPTVAQGQDEIRAGWEKAVEKVNAEFKARNADKSA